MGRTTMLLLIFFQIVNTTSAQQFESSNLPIIIIETNGQTIIDEPKITANMIVIDNSDGERNRVDSDVFQYEGSIGIEKRGQSSQDLFEKVSYGIETRDESGEDLDVELLGMPKESDWVLHSPYSDKSLLRNALAYQWAGEIMVYAPRVRHAELVINGDYKGVILFTEKIKRDKNRVDINKLKKDENEGDDLTGGYIIKFDKYSDGEVAWVSPYKPIPGHFQETRFIYNYPKKDKITDEQSDYIKSYITDFEDALMGPNFADPIIGYRAFIDVPSFVQTFIINELTRNVDGYRLSTYMYKDKDSKGGKLAMGPTWDHNLALGNANYCNGSNITGWAYDFNIICPDDFWVNHVWWKRLLEDEVFRQQLKDTWAELRADVFSTDNFLQRIDDLVGELNESAPRNFERWPVLNTYVWPNEFIGKNYNEEIDYLKRWISDRVQWLDDAYSGLTTAAIDIADSDDISVFPNPTNDEVQIYSSKELDYIEFYNIAGQYLKAVNIDHSSATIDFSTMGYNGLFIYRLYKQDGNVVVGRIVVTK